MRRRSGGGGAAGRAAWTASCAPCPSPSATGASPDSRDSLVNYPCCLLTWQDRAAYDGADRVLFAGHHAQRGDAADPGADHAGTRRTRVPSISASVLGRGLCMFLTRFRDVLCACACVRWTSNQIGMLLSIQGVFFFFWQVSSAASFHAIQQIQPCLLLGRAQWFFFPRVARRLGTVGCVTVGTFINGKFSSTEHRLPHHSVLIYFA